MSRYGITSAVGAGPHPAMRPDAPEPACAGLDTELWFDPAWGLLAVAICQQCPLMAACRDWSVPITDLHGVWGGLTAAQRAAVRTGRPVPELVDVDGVATGADPRCGTVAGHQAHRNGTSTAGLEPCEACRLARVAYDRRRKVAALLGRRRAAA